MFGGCCLAPEPCCVTGDTRCCEQALQICYFEDDDCIAGINSRKSEGEHTSWTDDQYEMMATLRAENLRRRDHVRSTQAAVKNVALCKGIKHEYREHVYASFKALTLFEFVNGLKEELQILSKEEIEVAMREDAMKKGGRAADLSKQRVASIHEGADYVTQEGDTVLHLAIDRWVTALLEKRRLARLHDSDPKDVEAQVGALATIEREFVALCVLGAPFGSINRDGLTPLMYATKLGASAILRALIACGGDYVNVRNAQRFPPLLLAAECGQVDTFAVLCEGLELQGKLSSSARFVGNGYNALHYATINNDKRVLAKALSYDAFKSPRVLNARSTDQTSGTASTMHNMGHHVLGQTALHKAVRYGHHQCLTILLEAGADPNLCDGRKQTPLHCAALGNHYECLNLLLLHGASVLARDGNGKRVFDVVHSRHHKIRGLLHGHAHKVIEAAKETDKAAADASPTKAKENKKKRASKKKRPPPPPPKA
ncbi:hypothetical protein JL722_2939 [Aureococcus anophagefferens]|nr:hypothetical protein JL722_2939 [Aureococcus anophagefferens]